MSDKYIHISDKYKNKVLVKRTRLMESMKVTFEKSLKHQVLKKIRGLPDRAILRRDIANLGSPRQISRALKALVEAKELVKLGYGIYAKLKKTRFSDKPYLEGGFLPVAREAFTKLGIDWAASPEEQDYNLGKSNAGAS